MSTTHAHVSQRTSSWERPSNENTHSLIREYLPKGTEILAHQPYLNAIADELNTPTPRHPRLPHIP